MIEVTEGSTEDTRSARLSPVSEAVWFVRLRRGRFGVCTSCFEDFYPSLAFCQYSWRYHHHETVEPDTRFATTSGSHYNPRLI